MKEDGQEGERRSIGGWLLSIFQSSKFIFVNTDISPTSPLSIFLQFSPYF